MKLDARHASDAERCESVVVAIAPGKGGEWHLTPAQCAAIRRHAWPDYTPEQMIPEIPFDVAEWGEGPDPWPGGLFKEQAEFDAAVEKSSALPRGAPLPPKR